MTAPQLDHCPACGHGFRRSKSAHFCREDPMLAAIPYRGDLEGTVLRPAPA